MRNVFWITGKELQNYFSSFIAFVVVAGFLLICGFFFSLILFYSQQASLEYLFDNMSVTLLLLCPILTMRLFSEEKSQGTLELLLTSPIREWELVVGKYLASLFLFLVMMIFTFLYPLLLRSFGNPDLGPIYTGYLGLFLLGGVYLAVGLFASSLTKNQIVAAVVGFAILLVLWFVDALSIFRTSLLTDITKYVSLSSHLEACLKGVLKSEDIIYFLSMILGSLYISMKIIESRKWK